MTEPTENTGNQIDETLRRRYETDWTTGSVGVGTMGVNNGRTRIKSTNVLLGHALGIVTGNEVGIARIGTGTVRCHGDDKLFHRFLSLRREAGSSLLQRHV